MSYAVIRSLLEVRLNGIDSPLPTAWENVPYSPTVGSAWQRVNLLPTTTQNPTMGDGFRREAGILQVTLHYPINAGPAAAATKAEAVRARFARGLSLNNGTLRVLIDQAPSIAPAFADDGWYVLPVSVPFIADVFA